MCSASASLVECDTKRRIIELHHHETMDFSAIARITSVPAEEVPYLACVACGRRDEDGDLRFDSKHWCQTMRLLALPYRDRDGYRAEWAPDGR